MEKQEAEGRNLLTKTPVKLLQRRRMGSGTSEIRITKSYRVRTSKGPC